MSSDSSAYSNFAGSTDDWSHADRWDGVERPYTPRRSEVCAARSGIVNTLWRNVGRASASGTPLATQDYVNALGALTGQPGRCSRSAPGSRRSTAPAGRSRPTPTARGRPVPRPEPLPRQQRAEAGAADQPAHLAARRSDRHGRGR